AELLVLFAWHMVELSAYPELAAARAPEKPRATAFVRRAAARGEPLVNLRHERVLVNEREQRLLPLLDGTRDRAQLGADVGPASDALGRNARILGECPWTRSPSFWQVSERTGAASRSRAGSRRSPPSAPTCARRSSTCATGPWDPTRAP